MSVSTAQLAAATTELSEWFVDMCDDLTALAVNAENEIARSRGRRSALADRDLRSVQSAADAFLERHPSPEAAGIIIRPGIVGTDGDIEWWKRNEDGTSSRVLFTLTPQTAGFYDFETLEWFRNVVETGQPTLTGPYLDYAGMDQYILTMTVPFRLGGDIIGAAGCDIDLPALEAALMPILRRIDADAALVSQHGRVVLGNSGRFLVGNRVTEVPAQGTSVDLDVPELGLRLIAVPRERF
ncbi:MAG: cache domain-containing protein [Microbacteriaceae bacterium]